MSKENKMLDIIGEIIETNSYGKIEILEYIGKTDKDHIYNIKFINTGNTKNETRSSIKRKSCIDELEKERIRKEKKDKEIEERRKLNAIKGKEVVYSNKKYNKILALDQSTTGCAYSIFVNKQLIKFGKIDTTKLSCSTEKIIKIRNEVQKMILEENVDILAIEDIYMHKNVEVFKTLAILYGTLQIIAFENNISFLSLVAYQWKSAMGIDFGYHNDYKKKRDYQKKSSVKRVNEIYALELKDDDICDSILIGLHTVVNCIKYDSYEEDTWS